MSLYPQKTSFPPGKLCKIVWHPLVEIPRSKTRTHKNWAIPEKIQSGRVEDIFFWKNSGTFRSAALPLEISRKTKLQPRNFHKIVLHPFEIPRLKKRDAWKIHMTHGYLNHSNLEMKAECLTKNLSCLNLDISTTKYGRNKL